MIETPLCPLGGADEVELQGGALVEGVVAEQQHMADGDAEPFSVAAQSR
ncbi:MAG: hypothetical protein AAFV53_35510 [Myxococcota bacterium]